MTASATAVSVFFIFITSSAVITRLNSAIPISPSPSKSAKSMSVSRTAGGWPSPLYVCSSRISSPRSAMPVRSWSTERKASVSRAYLFSIRERIDCWARRSCAAVTPGRRTGPPLRYVFLCFSIPFASVFPAASEASIPPLSVSLRPMMSSAVMMRANSA